MIGRRRLVLVLLVAAATSGGCGAEDDPGTAGRRLRLWHTFGPAETEALNQAVAARGLAVEASILPFARGQTVLATVLAAGDDCPDVARIDATWLPGLAQAGLLSEMPPASVDRHWRAAAIALARHGDRVYGAPQAIDGLALVYRPANAAALGAWPPETIASLDAAARRVTRSGPPPLYGLGVRVDGYWFLPFLRAAGAEVPISSEPAVRALAGFAALFADGVAPPPPPAGDEARDEARRFRAGELAVVMTGPWALVDLAGGELGDAPDLAVAPLPDAPLGGQIYVVPRCARAPSAAWALVAALTEPALQAAWSRRFGTVPTTEEGLADAGEVARAFAAALAGARPLPREAMAAEMFDDLNPAVAAVVAGDATAEEALAGVARAWARRAGARARRARIDERAAP